MNNKNIYLLGLPGSGKTTLGKQLAEVLGKKFIDLDEFIVENEKQSIFEIFNNKGEAVFREIEHNYLKILTKETNIVVATGGGAACFYDNIDLMNETGYTVFLNVSDYVLFERIKIQKNLGILRPVLNKDSYILKSITEMLNQRLPFYNKSQYIITDDNIKVEDILKTLN